MYVDITHVLNGYCTINSLEKLSKTNGVIFFIKTSYKITNKKVSTDFNSNEIEIEIDNMTVTVLGYILVAK